MTAFDFWFWGAAIASVVGIVLWVFRAKEAFFVGHKAGAEMALQMAWDLLPRDKDGAIDGLDPETEYVEKFDAALRAAIEGQEA